MVEVLYFADFKSITSKEKEHFPLTDEKSLKELVQQLTDKYPKLEQILLDHDSKKLNDSISISINHSIVNRQKIDAFKLENEDKVAFLLPVSGG